LPRLKKITDLFKISDFFCLPVEAASKFGILKPSQPSGEPGRGTSPGFPILCSRNVYFLAGFLPGRPALGAGAAFSVSSTRSIAVAGKVASWPSWLSLNQTAVTRFASISTDFTIIFGLLDNPEATTISPTNRSVALTLIKTPKDKDISPRLENIPNPTFGKNLGFQEPTGKNTSMQVINSCYPVIRGLPCFSSSLAIILEDKLVSKLNGF
jgi:hypothetical protein